MVITISSIKGGVGKSSTVLLLANNLAARGRKVLVVDMDLNNTVTIYYTMGIGKISEICERQNISLAYAQVSLDGNIISSRRKNIDIVPSSLRLVDQRSTEDIRLKMILQKVKGYDDILTDTSPTYDSLVLAALRAADLIISPVQFTEYNFNMSVFLMNKIRTVLPEQASKAYFLFNHWNEQYAKYPSSLQSQVLNMYQRSFSNLLSVKLPDTRYVDRYTNFDEKLSVNSIHIGNRRLALGINALASMITGEEKSVEEF